MWQFHFSIRNTLEVGQFLWSGSIPPKFIDLWPFTIFPYVSLVQPHILLHTVPVLAPFQVTTIARCRVQIRTNTRVSDCAARCWA